MKVSFTFDDADERNMHKVHSQALDMYFALGDIDNMLRGMVKHGADGTSQRLGVIEMDMADRIRSNIRSILNESNISMELLE